MSLEGVTTKGETVWVVRVRGVDESLGFSVGSYDNQSLVGMGCS